LHNGWLIPFYKDQAEVIRNFPKLLFPFHNSLRNVTFFVTPELVGWFDEKNSFMQNALDHIYRDWSASAQKLNDVRLPKDHQYFVQSRVAVVDRIPFSNGKSSGLPGISMAVTKRSGTWLSKSGQSKGTKKEISKMPVITVTLPFPEMQKGRKILRILLRPSNTLFVTGLPATMFIEKWAFNEEAVTGKMLSRCTERVHVDHFELYHMFEKSSLAIPLQRLTEPRAIYMCMGNIISKLMGEQASEPISASHELEGKVSAFMAGRNATNGTLSVFALITPKLGAEIRSTQGPAVPNEILGYYGLAGTTEGSPKNQLVQDHIRVAIAKGAHLHRVTGGGGGWGKKQGLLSLEPAMDFGAEASESCSSWPPEDFDTNSKDNGSFWTRKSAPEVASPGDIVEFYGAFISKEEEQALIQEESIMTALRVPNAVCRSSRSWAEEDTSNIVWGVIPPQDSIGASTASNLSDDLIPIPHHFGMLSEQGMVLQRLDLLEAKQAPGDSEITHERARNVTKIDAPHTVLTYSIPNRMAFRSNENENISWRKVEQRAPPQNDPISLVEVGSVPVGRRAPETNQKEEHSTPGKTPVRGISERGSSRRTQRTSEQRGGTARSEAKIIKYTAPIWIRRHQAGH
jgi:hypothetical protein